jgi:two-component system sensor histidine kinase UhpB
MVTGQGDEGVAVEAMKHGASDYLVKDVEGRYLALLPYEPAGGNPGAAPR